MTHARVPQAPLQQGSLALERASGSPVDICMVHSNVPLMPMRQGLIALGLWQQAKDPKKAVRVLSSSLTRYLIKLTL